MRVLKYSKPIFKGQAIFRSVLNVERELVRESEGEEVDIDSFVLRRDEMCWLAH